MAGLTGTGSVVIEPFFLEAPSGPLFAVHHRPANRANERGQVLCVPPFNEEMNRCRSMMTVLAKSLAALGFGTLVLDLYGTGDSAGEYRDARWPTWLDDVRAAQAWLQQRPGGIKAVLGVRLGAILAAEVNATSGVPSVPLVLWQPALEGKVHLTQFFRVRMAAQLDRNDLPKESTASMRQQLLEGQTLEVAGYEIHPELARSIDGARLFDQKLGAGTRVLWLENASAGKSELSPASSTAVAAWQAAGAVVDALTYQGAAFWQVHERVLTPAIVEETSAWLDKNVAVS